jgi:hypothetical protein
VVEAAHAPEAKAAHQPAGWGAAPAFLGGCERGALDGLGGAGAELRVVGSDEEFETSKGSVDEGRARSHTRVEQADHVLRLGEVAQPGHREVVTVGNGVQVGGRVGESPFIPLPGAQRGRHRDPHAGNVSHPMAA